MNRRAAFTPLHHPNCERPPIFPDALEHRTLKRHKCRAPIPAVSTGQPKPVERLVARILSAKQREGGAGIPACQTEADKNVCATLERELDEWVSALYGLTADETKIAQETTG